MTPQEIREQQQFAVDQKLRAKREERLNDVGGLALLPAEEVTLGQFNYHGDALRRLDPIKYSLIQRNLLIHLVKNELIEGHDYGLIPGCGDKPALKKPGAERIADFFQYSIEVDCTSKFEDYDKGLFAYTYKATVRRKDGSFVQCEANCNSKEKKYGQRKVNKQYASEKEKQSAIGESSYYDKKERKTTHYWVLNNEDIFSIVNTIMKMSEKRAIVGAVLLASNASGFFENAEQMTPREVPENRPTWDIEAQVVDEDPVISEPQRRRLFAIATESGYSTDGTAMKAMLETYGVESSKTIKVSQYELICKAAENKAMAAFWNSQVAPDPELKPIEREPIPALD
jgi:hypothetical protein